MDVLITCKNQEPIKNEGARVSRTISPLRLEPGIAFICQEVIIDLNMAGIYMSVLCQGSNPQPPD